MRDVWLCHPTANANSRQVALALEEAGRLSEFHTSLAIFPGTVLDRAAQLPSLSVLRRRRLDPQIQARMKCWPWREVGRLLSKQAGGHALIRHETGMFSVDAVYRAADVRVATALTRARQSPRALYTYEDAALAAFQVARDRGVARLYELPIGYWRVARRLFEDEAERKPEWAGTLLSLRDSPEKLERKDAELRLAEHIFVASAFTRETLAQFPGVLPPVTVVPYGAPRPVREIAATSSSPKLRVLFVGELSQRKGLSYLLDAAALLGESMELTLIGMPTETCRPLEAALRRKRWLRGAPHGQVLEEMRRADVLVFPSLFEGFGLVITEALSQGIPVITTPHTAGPDVLTEGETGFVVPIRDAAAIAERLERLHRDRPFLQSMKDAARRSAEQLNWENYRQSIGREISAAIVDSN